MYNIDERKWLINEGIIILITIGRIFCTRLLCLHYIQFVSMWLFPSTLLFKTMFFFFWKSTILNYHCIWKNNRYSDFHEKVLFYLSTKLKLINYILFRKINFVKCKIILYCCILYILLNIKVWCTLYMYTYGVTDVTFCIFYVCQLLLWYLPTYYNKY